MNLAVGPAAGAAGGPNRPRVSQCLTHAHANTHVSVRVLLRGHLVAMCSAAGCRGACWTSTHKPSHACVPTRQPEQLSDKPWGGCGVNGGFPEDTGNTCHAVGNGACHQER